MNPTAERVSIITVLRTLALAALTASTSAWAGGVVTTCDETHLNTALSGGGTVTFNCGSPATIIVTSTKIISANTTIDGTGGITISGGNSVPVFVVNSGSTFTVQQLTIANGKGSGLAGGITNNGTTVVTASVFSGNTGGDGGAIHSGNSLTVTGGTIFTGNTATIVGGAIYNDGTANITSANINGNTVTGIGYGGGIYNDFTMTIASSEIFGNSAGPNGGNGGGIFNASTLTISDTTVSGNTTAGGGNGAGIYHGGDSLTMDRNTISGNTASGGADGGGDGGGIYIGGFGATITNVTISGNSAAAGGGLFKEAGVSVNIAATTIASNTGGGISSIEFGLSIITGTIVANNGTNCAGGTISDLGTNLQFPGTTCGLSIPSADPLLQPLANNGGLTQTMALTAGSPAINASTERCPPPSTDQRGVTRPQGPACDIGAFELKASGSPPPGLANVIEYYAPQFDDYFITLAIDEIHALDTQAIPGWYRTGYSFEAYVEPMPGADPLCRFYIPPASHFFSGSSAECAAVLKFNVPPFVYESPNSFYLPAPDMTTGVCPAGLIPVYRLYNNKPMLTNHRYTTDLAVKAQMVAKGYIAEGYGPDRVMMCAPN